MDPKRKNVTADAENASDWTSLAHGVRARRLDGVVVLVELHPKDDRVLGTCDDERQSVAAVLSEEYGGRWRRVSEWGQTPPVKIAGDVTSRWRVDDMRALKSFRPFERKDRFDPRCTSCGGSTIEGSCSNEGCARFRLSTRSASGSTRCEHPPDRLDRTPDAGDRSAGELCGACRSTRWSRDGGATWTAWMDERQTRAFVDGMRFTNAQIKEALGKPAQMVVPDGFRLAYGGSFEGPPGDATVAELFLRSLATRVRASETLNRAFASLAELGAEARAHGDDAADVDRPPSPALAETYRNALKHPRALADLCKAIDAAGSAAIVDVGSVAIVDADELERVAVRELDAAASAVARIAGTLEEAPPELARAADRTVADHSPTECTDAYVLVHAEEWHELQGALTRWSQCSEGLLAIVEAKSRKPKPAGQA